jgi:acyl carrier protein
MHDLLLRLREILETPGLLETDDMKVLELWDSLTVLSILAVIDEKFDVTIDEPELARINTPLDLYDLIQSRVA